MPDKKIVVAGAGHGGLVSAIKLCENGYDVTVYEKSNEASMGYDWTDDFDINVFDEVELPRPRKSTYYLKHNWTFVSPDKETYVSINIPEADRDVSMERKPLIKHLIDLAKETGVKIHYGITVKGPCIENDKVVGIIFDDGNAVRADLVIDAAGLKSPIREQLPDGYGVVKKWKERESFFNWRAHYERLDGPEPKHDATVYFKHLGHPGISWVVYAPNNEVNVLIGQTSPLDETIIEETLSDLRAEHPCLGNEVVRGGLITEIPIRRPLDMMVGDNYAAVGDSAFMTIPVMGSGIAASMIAGDILAKILIKNSELDNPYCLESLWPYQAKFFQQLGAGFTSIELMKNYLLGIPEEDLNFLFSRNIIGAKELSNSATGGELSLSIVDVVTKLVRGIIKAPLLLEIKKLTDKCSKVKEVCTKIPDEYDAERVRKWQNAVNKYFK